MQPNPATHLGALIQRVLQHQAHHRLVRRLHKQIAQHLQQVNTEPGLVGGACGGLARMLHALNRGCHALTGLESKQLRVCSHGQAQEAELPGMVVPHATTEGARRQALARGVEVRRGEEREAGQVGYGKRGVVHQLRHACPV
eukprot:828035-Pelagomonas_calceolata.AAC.12